MPEKIAIAELMETSGVKFGTSGARGLVSDMTDAVCYAYTAGFLQYLEEIGELPGAERRVTIAGDLRASTGRIMTAVGRAVADRGYLPVNCGRIPSPAVALYGIAQGIPAIMVTGSHIPDDRNGIKFNKASGEVLKEDEVGMTAQAVALPAIFTAQGMLAQPFALGPVDDAARRDYRQRYLKAFPAGFLRGQSIGLYQHSAVGRDLLVEILSGLGAEITPLARSERFIPVDTEAIRAEDVRLAAEWAAQYHFDAILSTDGDGDRPLIADETGKWLRGDIAGILCARFCQAVTVVTPVSSNTAVERCGWFTQVLRTRIGSPYVIAAMLDAVAEGSTCVVGYEANGGFLTASPVQIDDHLLAPLPTRDPVIVHLAVLGLAASEGKTIAQLEATLPRRYTASDRLKDFPAEISRPRLQSLIAGGSAAITALFPEAVPVEHIDTTDGPRIIFTDGDIIHLRPSGNAPELRCYAEADSEERARELVRRTLEKLAAWREG